MQTPSTYAYNGGLTLLPYDEMLASCSCRRLSECRRDMAGRGVRWSGFAQCGWWVSVWSVSSVYWLHMSGVVPCDAFVALGFGLPILGEMVVDD